MGEYLKSTNIPPVWLGRLPPFICDSKAKIKGAVAEFFSPVVRYLVLFQIVHRCSLIF